MKTRPTIALPIALLALALAPFAAPVQAKSAAPPDSGVEQARGTEQIKGGDGVFGVVYTMQAGYNLQIIKARYTLEPHIDYSGTVPQPDEKIFVVTFAVKNSKANEDVAAMPLILLVDDKENNYQMDEQSIALASNGAESMYISLKPGQGMGQDPVANELSIAARIPGRAKIKKIVVQDGRASVPDEKVLRFAIAGYPNGSPKNVVSPLPKYAADPTDPTGAVALESVPAVMGKYYPDGYFAVRLDNVTFSADAEVDGVKPEEDKKWAIATFTAKNVTLKDQSTFYLGNDEGVALVDSDGEKYTPTVGKRKAMKDAAASDVSVSKGEEYTFRYFVQVPKGVKLKELRFPSGGNGHNYLWALTTPTTP